VRFVLLVSRDFWADALQNFESRARSPDSGPRPPFIIMTPASMLQGFGLLNLQGQDARAFLPPTKDPVDHTSS